MFNGLVEFAKRNKKKIFIGLGIAVGLGITAVVTSKKDEEVEVVEPEQVEETEENDEPAEEIEE